MQNEFIVALSHDVDRVHKSFQSLTHFVKHIRHGRLRSAIYQMLSVGRSETYWCFEKIREIESARRLRSTYFFLNESYPFHLSSIKSWRLSLGYYSIFSPRVMQAIRSLDSEGFEVGLHGSYLSYADPNLLAREKTDLEKILGHEVEGIRQHYLNLAPETWPIQRSLGFLYDASFGYRDRIGFQDDRYVPFELDERKDFFIMPQAIMDCCLMRLRDPWRHARGLIDLAESKKALLVLNWHQQVFDENEFPGWSQMYVQIVDECLKRGARFMTLGQYVRQYCIVAAGTNVLRRS